MSVHNIEDLDTGEFMAVHHPDVPVEAFRKFSSRIKGLKQDPTNTGKNMECLIRFMDDWRVKFLEFRGRDYCDNQ